jgi:HSP20 family protein
VRVPQSAPEGDFFMAIDTAPDQPFQHISRNVNKIIEQMQKGYYNFRPNDTWAPNVNLYENDHAYLVCVDLAGVDKSKIDLELADSRLTLRGSREVPSFVEEDRIHPAHQQQGKVRVHVMEIDHGSFYREVELPRHVERDRINAHYRNGMLWIEIPKR